MPIRRLVACLLVLILSAPALAGLQEGISAYRIGDYSKALAELRPLADQGEPQAQWTLGLMYAQGSGVLQDYVQAHKWLNLAASRGYREAPRMREEIARRMTPNQIAQAQQLARQWQPSARAPAAPPPTPSWQPPPPKPSAATVARIQALLADQGYDPGPPDGVMGGRTRDAIRAYQRDRGLAEDGEPSDALLSRLESEPPPRASAPPAQASPAASPMPPGTSDQRLQSLVDELGNLVGDAQRRRLADARFLDDLRSLASRYDDPWRRVLLEEDFSSKQATTNRGWRVASGDFQISAARGLQTRVEAVQAKAPKSAEAQALELLGAIIQSQVGKDGDARVSTGQARVAEVFVPLRVTDAFAVRVELRSQRTPARFEVALYRSGDRSDGNAVVYTAGEGVVIQSRSAGGATPLMRSRRGVTLEDGAAHVLEWRRNRAGIMSVLVDGVALADVKEPGGGFSGLALRNRGGEFTVRSVTVRGTP